MKSFRALWLGFLLLCFGTLQSQAQSTRATVRLDGRAVFEVSAETREAARQRADRIETRLNRVLQTPGALAPVQIAPSGANRALSIGGRSITILAPEDARDNDVSLDALDAQWKNAADAALNRAAKRRISAWGRFAAETQSSIGTAFGRLLESAITVVPRLLASALVLLFFWILASLTRWIMRLIFRRIVSDLTLKNLIKQVAYYFVWAIGLILATSALDLDPQALATGLGLTGVALGFALKDILSNFVSGVLILAIRAFEIGDQIVIGDTEGSVERISLRATQIKTYDGRAVIVPNAEVFTSRITNNTSAPFRRNSIRLFVGYDADLKRAVEVATRAASQVAGVEKEPAPSVRVSELGADDIVVDVRFWSDSRRSDFVATASAVRVAVVEAFKVSGIGLPDPDVRVLTRREKTANCHESS